MTGTALVLGGGGITGIAWEIGLLVGLRRAGVDLTDATLVVGTSAGAFVGALVATGVDPEQAARTAGGDQLTDLTPRIDMSLLAQAFAVMSDGGDPGRARARLGALARSAPVGDAERQVALFGSRLPVHEWPTSPRLVVTAVDTGTGEPVAWDASSRVPLVAAVAASCAVPCVFPPVPVGAGVFMDGGVRSVTNADLAAGSSAVVVVAPTVGVFRSSPTQELRALDGARTILLTPDPTARAAIGPNILDPGRRSAALAAGVAQGAAVAATVAPVWRPGG